MRVGVGIGGVGESGREGVGSVCQGRARRKKKSKKEK